MDKHHTKAKNKAQCRYKESPPRSNHQNLSDNQITYIEQVHTRDGNIRKIITIQREVLL